jgi:phenol hydroxylase P5 protein
VPALSEAADPQEWPGERGFVHEVARRLFSGDFRGLKAYLCGPPAMIDACVTTLMRGRLFERDMFMEKFLSAADTEQAARRSPLFKAV